MNRIKSVLLVLVAGLGTLLIPADVLPAHAVSCNVSGVSYTTCRFEACDLFVSMGTNGKIAWWRPDQCGIPHSMTFVGLLSVPDLSGSAFSDINTGAGMAFNVPSCALGPGHPCLYETEFYGENVATFDVEGTYLGTCGTGYFSPGVTGEPESIVIDTSSTTDAFHPSGVIYVGEGGGSIILKFNLDCSAGTPASFSPSLEHRGTDWIDLVEPDAGDIGSRCDLQYTSEGTRVLTFDVCSNTQEADLTSSLPTGFGSDVAYAHRELRTDHSVLIADTGSIVHLDSAGKQISTCPNGSFRTFYGLAVLPDSTAFVTGDTGPDYRSTGLPGSGFTEYMTVAHCDSGSIPDFNFNSIPQGCGITCRVDGLAVFPRIYTHTVAIEGREGAGIVATGQTIPIGAFTSNAAGGIPTFFQKEPSPSGTMLFTDGESNSNGGGTFLTPNPCTLNPVPGSPGVSSCYTSYTAPSTSGLDIVRAAYRPDDNTHLYSNDLAFLSVISINVAGASSSTAYTDSAGSNLVSLCCGPDGQVAVITYPPGTDFSGGTVTGYFSTSGGITQVYVTGPTLPPGGTKTVEIGTHSKTNTVCIVDSPTPPSGSPNCAATDPSSRTVVFSTVSGPPVGISTCPGSVTFGTSAITCTFSFHSFLYFFKITGLAHSFVETFATSVKVSQFFTDGDMNSLPLDANGNPSVSVIISPRGIAKGTSPGVVLAWVNATNTGNVAFDSLALNETLPVDWSVSPSWLQSNGAIHVFLDLINGTLVEITDPGTIKVSAANPETITVSIPDLTATDAQSSLMPGMSILVSVKISYALKGTSQLPSSYPRTYTDAAVAVASTQPSFRANQASDMISSSFTAEAKVVS